MEKLFKALMQNNFEKFKEEHKYYTVIQKVKYQRAFKDFQKLENEKFLFEHNKNFNKCQRKEIYQTLSILIDDLNDINDLIDHIYYIDYQFDNIQNSLKFEYLYDDKFINVNYFVDDETVIMEIYEFYDITKNIYSKYSTFQKCNRNNDEFKLANLVETYCQDKGFY